MKNMYFKIYTHVFKTDTRGVKFIAVLKLVVTFEYTPDYRVSLELTIYLFLYKGKVFVKLKQNIQITHRDLNTF